MNSFEKRNSISRRDFLKYLLHLFTAVFLTNAGSQVAAEEQGRVEYDLKKLIMPGSTFKRYKELLDELEDRMHSVELSDKDGVTILDYGDFVHMEAQRNQITIREWSKKRSLITLNKEIINTFKEGIMALGLKTIPSVFSGSPLDFLISFRSGAFISLRKDVDRRNGAESIILTVSNKILDDFCAKTEIDKSLFRLHNEASILSFRLDGPVDQNFLDFVCGFMFTFTQQG